MFAAPAAPGADAFFPGRVLLRMNAFICGVALVCHACTTALFRTGRFLP